MSFLVSFIKCLKKQRVILLTEIIGNFVCAVCKHPEEDSFSAADWLAPFIHPGCYEYTTGLNVLHEDITCNRQVLPATLKGFSTVNLVNLPINILTETPVLKMNSIMYHPLTTDSLLRHWWFGPHQSPTWWVSQSEPVVRWRREVQGQSGWCSTQTPPSGQQSMEPLSWQGFLQGVRFSLG